MYACFSSDIHNMHGYISFLIQCDGKELRWKHILDLYQRNTGAVRSAPGLSLVPKLTFEHVMLTSFSKMRVDLAAQVHCTCTVYMLLWLCVIVLYRVSGRLLVHTHALS